MKELNFYLSQTRSLHHNCFVVNCLELVAESDLYVFQQDSENSNFRNLTFPLPCCMSFQFLVLLGFKYCVILYCFYLSIWL